MARGVRPIFDQIDAMGGVLRAVDRGYFRRAIAESALEESRRVDRGEQTIVGVTKFQEVDSPGIPTLKIEQHVEDEQVARLTQLKRTRAAARHAAALERLQADAETNTNVMPALIAAAQADATVGEMMDALKAVYGTYDGGPEW